MVFFHVGSVENSFLSKYFFRVCVSVLLVVFFSLYGGFGGIFSEHFEQCFCRHFSLVENWKKWPMYFEMT